MTRKEVIETIAGCHKTATERAREWADPQIGPSTEKVIAGTIWMATACLIEALGAATDLVVASINEAKP